MEGTGSPPSLTNVDVTGNEVIPVEFDHLSVQSVSSGRAQVAGAQAVARTWVSHAVGLPGSGSPVARHPCPVLTLGQEDATGEARGRGINVPSGRLRG